MIETGRVSFYVLQSPGIALFLVAIYCTFTSQTKKRFVHGYFILQDATKRSWPALASIFAFLIAARLLVEIGGIKALALTASNYGLYSAAAATATLGAIGSYVTGSGTASTALFMTGAAAIGENLNATSLFASIQISAGAHVGVASLPIIAILLAALPNEEVNDKRTAVRFGLTLGTIWLLLVITSGAIQIAMPWSVLSLTPLTLQDYQFHHVVDAEFHQASCAQFFLHLLQQFCLEGAYLL